MSGNAESGREIERLKGKNACCNDCKDWNLRLVEIFPCPVYCENNKNKSNYPEYDTNRDAKSAIAKQKIRDVRSVSPVYYNNTYSIISITAHDGLWKRYYFNTMN